ncbi:MAG: hypothetical protein Sapg2KO_47840 [Saprospiraceae bacterium]
MVQVQAQVNILRVYPIYENADGSQQCGALQFELLGEMGPFEVTIEDNSNGAVLLEKTGQTKGIQTIDDEGILCTGGTYTINVKNRQSCIFSETFLIRGCWDHTVGIPYEILQYPTDCTSKNGQIAVDKSVADELLILLSGPSGNIPRRYDEAAEKWIWEGVSIGEYKMVARTKDCGYTIFNDISIDQPELEALVLDDCNGSNSGSINLIEGLGLLNAYSTYEIQWDDLPGQDNLFVRSDLAAGTYTANISTKAGASVPCTFQQEFIIEASQLEITKQTVVNNQCGGETCTGSIDLEVTTNQEVNYLWSNGATTQDIATLCSGDYEVTITAGDCEEVLSFQIETPPVQDWAYEVEVQWGYNSDWTNRDWANVHIISDVFKEGNGELQLSLSPSMDDLILPNNQYEKDGIGDVNIPFELATNTIFYFRYQQDNGCVYTGVIENPNLKDIPLCDEGEDNFSFNVFYEEDPFATCTPDGTYEYQIVVYSSGKNEPFFIEVSMVEAFYEEDTAFTKIERLENIIPGSYTIGGIPAGIAQFKAYNLCDQTPTIKQIESPWKANCCPEFSCEPQDITVGDISTTYQFEYIQIRARDSEVCFNEKSGSGDEDYSNIEILDHRGQLISGNNTTLNKCWTGIITIEYPPRGGQASEPYVLEVLDLNPNDINYNIVHSSGDDNWAPDSEGTYEVKISYTGTGASADIDCEYTFEVEYLGKTNPDLAVGLRNFYPSNFDYYLDKNGLDKPYYAAWVCETCSEREEERKYITNTNDCIIGKGGLNLQYFRFHPNLENWDGSDYNALCNLGGELEILDYDEDNIPTLKRIEIPATPNDVSYNLGFKQQPLPNNDPSIIYTQSGWCVFDGELVYGENFDQAILATWFDPSSEVDVWVPGDDSSNGPCEETGPNACPEGTICDGGRCVVPCEDGNCLNGTCVNGICETSEEDLKNTCPVECPDGYLCYNGECILEDEPCGFSIEHSGKGSQNYRFGYKDLPAQKIYLKYNTFRLKDRIQVFIDGNLEFETKNANDNYGAYVGTEGELETYEMDISGSGLIEISVRPYEGSKKSKFNFEILCSLTAGFTDTDNGIIGIEKVEKVLQEYDFTIQPNPFSGEINLEINAVASKTVDLLIIDELGKKVLQQKIDLLRGFNQKTIAADRLAAGIYFVRLVDETNQYLETKKLIKY